MTTMKHLAGLTLIVLFLPIIHCRWVKNMENRGAFQGDIILDPDEMTNNDKTYASIKGGKWPGMVVPYVIDRSIGSKTHRGIQEAIAQYHQHTCIKWKPRTNERTYVVFHHGQGCWSPIGYRAGRVNRISLGDGCHWKDVVMHEMAHTLGFFHEQARPDRDKYVRILWDNIRPDQKYNFNKQSYGDVEQLQTPYDFNSVMHYAENMFGINNRRTIQAIDPRNQRLMGNEKGFSKLDIKDINIRYPCNSGGGVACGDKHANCGGWARGGYCRKSRDWMSTNCRKSCRLC